MIDRNIHSSLLINLAMFCPLYDHGNNSVQERACACFNKRIDASFRAQESRRLDEGAKLALQSVFGDDFRNHESDLSRRFLLQQAEQFWCLPELLTGYSGILEHALLMGDRGFFQKLVGKLKGPPMQLGKEKDDKCLPELQLKQEILRNWTNPDLPLWLMSDPAFKQAIRLITAGAFCDGRTLHKTLQRLNLTRSRRKPIRNIVLTKQPESDRLRFERFVFAKYLKGMEGVPTPSAYGQTGIWLFGHIDAHSVDIPICSDLCSGE